MLPAAASNTPLGFVNALFPATSASCVTGLIVVDTAKDLTLFGQIVVLALIQIGGIGILTFSTVFLLIAGRKTGLAGRYSLQDTFTNSGESSVITLVLRVVRLTLAIEVAGALLLFLGFVRKAAASHALYLSVFHAISASVERGETIARENGLQLIE